mmetsp:Transcript_6339/g.5739  ORF Transcript_6339/g.5739 Transcript_6339/m.5739 type:complete len:87 (-) Transcript_6339:378-638(-)
MSYEGSEDWIRNEFYNYLKNFLTEMAFFKRATSDENIGYLVRVYNQFVEEDEVRRMRDESLNAESDPSLNIEKPRKNSTGKNSKNT